MKALGAIIVDDEKLAIDSLLWELKAHKDRIEVLFSTSDPFEAISKIDSLRPDILFLDIDMPQMDGFQLLKEVSFKRFELIFTTAYDNYVIDALRIGALDYLLKPISSEDLSNVIERVISKERKGYSFEDIEPSLNHLFSNKVIKQKIALPMERKVVMVEQEHILYCESEGSYTQVYIETGEKYLISKNLKYISQKLHPGLFLRIHQSYIVNLNAIKEYHRGDGGDVLLQNGKSIPVSRNNKDSLLRQILK